MLRIRDNLIKKLYKTDLSKFELVAMLELIKIADSEGNAQVHYKEMVQNIGCTIASFYNCINKLEEMEFLERYKNQEHKQEMVIGIYNNNFGQAADHRGYVKLNNKFFADSEYKVLSAGEIRVMLYLMFRTAKGAYDQDVESVFHDKNKMYYKDNYKSIAKQLGITRRMAKIYLKALLDRKLISIGEHEVERDKKKYDVITVAHKMLSVFTVQVTEKGKTKDKNITELQPHFSHCIKNFCRRLRKNVPNDIVLNDTAELIEQYRAIAEQKGKDIYKLIQSAIGSLRGDILNSKTVHSILKVLLERESVIVYY